MVSLRKRKTEETEEPVKASKSESSSSQPRAKRARKATSTTATIADETPASAPAKKKASVSSKSKSKAASETSATATKKSSTTKSSSEEKPKKTKKTASVKSEEPSASKPSKAITKKQPASRSTSSSSKTGNGTASRTSSAVARATLIAKHASKAASKTSSLKPPFNSIPTLPTQKLNVYVFGSGSICELGLGPVVTEVKRPRLNPLLPIDKAGITKVAVGGTHVLCIDHEGRLWSWGQNDCGVLGRATKESDDEVDDDWAINSKESTPNYVEGLPESAIFVDIAATDNLSAAITDQGHLYAWGTFNDEGKKCFKKGVEYQREPAIVSSVRGAVQLAGGKDHLLILDKKGDVYAWGVGTSNQLGVSVNSELRTFVFGPLKVPGLKHIKSVAAGEFHSFAIDDKGDVYAWGLNNFGQAGLLEPLGEGAVLIKPTKVSFFEENKLNVVQIACGNHHTLALTDKGDIYAFGEIYLNQLGIDSENYPDSLVRDAQTGSPAYVPVPTKLTKGSFDDEPSFPEKGFKFIACGTEHCLAISASDGSPWTWGSGSVYQLGHGKPAGEDDPEDLAIPTRIDNTASRGVDMVFAGAGAQFSVICGLPKDQPATNGSVAAPKKE